MKASELDKRFDDGEDITGELDVASARRPNREQRRVNVDFPTWMIASLDREAARLGVTRQSIIKVWIAERLEKAPDVLVTSGMLHAEVDEVVHAFANRGLAEESRRRRGEWSAVLLRSVGRSR